MTTQFDLQEFFHRHQQMQQHQNNANQPQKTPAPIKINQKTITTANNTYKSIIEKDGLLDELNSLQEKINKKVKDNAKLKALLPKSLQDKKENFFEIIELPKVETSSGVSSATEEKGITKTEKGPDGKE